MRIWMFMVLGLAALVAAPILVIMAHLFVPSLEVWQHLATTVLPRYVGNSLGLMLGVGAGTLVLGVSTAWLVSMTSFPWRRFFEWSLIIPLAIPAYVIAFTYTGLLEYGGPVQTLLRETFGWRSAADYWFPQIRSLPGAIVMMTLVFYPYVYMLSRAAFLEQSVCVLDASRTLGRGAWSTFFGVALPLARPAVAGGLALALMETLNDFGTVDFFAVDTFVTGIYRTWLGLGQPAIAAQLGAVLMFFILGLILLERWSRRGRVSHTTGYYRQLPRFQLSGISAGLAFTVCFLPVFFGFILPVGAMVIWTWQTWNFVDPRYLRMAGTSLSLAGISAVAAVGAAVLLAYGRRLVPGKVTGIAVQTASLGYAIPGAVIALGIMIPFAFLDNTVDNLARTLFGYSTGLLLTGTWTALIFAYVVRFLAVSTNTVEASLQKVTPNMDGAARTLGLSAGQTLRRVHGPIMRASLLTAGVLVFVDVMKELPATLMMRPFGLNTLAIRSYELASDGLLKESSSSSLAIVLAGIIPVILASLMIARSRPGQT
ncbi:iron ABC transporter permease [Desulfonatronum sp. SC1]|uniref:ABC transporter permease n=1 Tax=Desulfonatronum sp. SC1 TaxID=2109626 RepID=UPI0018EE6214|nr:iron ABC transporter permease [Desulfonatronum sp. SC1]